MSASARIPTVKSSFSASATLSGYPFALATLIILYVVVFASLSIHRFNLMGDCYDLSVFEQSFWSTVHEGKLLFNSQEGNEFGLFSHFSHHFSPLLLFVVPFYAIWQSAKTLLVVKTIALGLGAWPLSVLAGRFFDSPRAGLVAALLYLMYPPLHGVNLWGFHENDFTVTPLAFLLLAHERKAWRQFWIWAVVALCAKETTGLTLAAFGFYLFLFKPEKGRGAILALAALTWFLIADRMLIPVFGGRQVFQIENRFLSARYDPMIGQSYGEILQNCLLHPFRIGSYVFGDLRKLSYLFKLFFPLGFLPFSSPGLLLAFIPVLGENLLARYHGQYVILGQYHAELVPFLFYGTFQGAQRIAGWIKHPSRSRALLAWLTLPTLIANVGFEVWPFAMGRMNFMSAIAKPSESRRAAKELMAMIPPWASVLTETSLISHLGGRKWLHGINAEAMTAREWDCVIFDARSAWATDVSDEEFKRFLIERGYRLAAEREDIYLFEMKDKLIGSP